MPKSNEAYSTLSAILQLLNCRNQQVNTLQTITTVFLYANHNLITGCFETKGMEDQAIYVQKNLKAQYASLTKFA